MLKYLYIFLFAVVEDSPESKLLNGGVLGAIVAILLANDFYQRKVQNSRQTKQDSRHQEIVLAVAKMQQSMDYSTRVTLVDVMSRPLANQAMEEMRQIKMALEKDK